MSGPQTCLGASMLCTFGAAPSSLVVTPEKKTMTNVPAANIMDNIPCKSIPPFAMCTSLANPAVAAATTAALGVLTPMPCVPATAAPWAPGNPKVMIANMPALDMNSKLVCSFGGAISFVSPGQTKAIHS